MTVTAGWPLDRLVKALAKSGWDVLTGRQGGGYRAVLRALADLLPPAPAPGLVTAPQLADVSGLSEKWVRTILTNLETAGVIRWTRGTIIAGKPQPSLIRVSKRALADLVNRGRKSGDARLARRAAATAKRINETLRVTSLARRWSPRPVDPPAPVPVRSRPLSVRAELSSTLPPNGEGPGVVTSPGSVSPEQIAAHRAALRAALAGGRTA